MVRRNGGSLRVVGLFLFLCLANTASVFGQAGIAGVVKDATGAVLPGVSVEAASPALIEKVRTVVTDGEGLYKIVELRPGTYTVTFSLTGFNTVRREGIELAGSFTASVNAEMRVGALEETITVSGQSPTVDTQSVTQQRVLTRNIMDDIPVGTKTLVALGVLIPGVVATSVDVGGTGASASSIAIHGGRTGEEQLLQDGMSYHTGAGRGGGFSAVRANEASASEISMETSGLNAESEMGGIRTNVIPKEGGNTFHSYTNFRFGNHSMQANNLNDTLRSRGLTSPDALDHIINFTQGFGGPIRKDKLWFYSAFQMLRVDTQVAGVFFNLTPQGPFYTPDPSKPALDNQNEGDLNSRITWQISPKNKLNVFHQKDWNLREHWYGEGGGTLSVASPEAVYTDTVIPTYFGQITWNSPVSNRLLLESGVVLTKRDFMRREPVDPGGFYAYRELRGGVHSIVGNADPFTNFLGHNDSYQYNIRFAASYVTGSHAFKVGTTFLHAGNTTTQTTSGDGMTLQLLDGVPRQVTVYAIPLRFDETMKATIGVFAQDQWSWKRVVVNAGVRYDYQNSYVPAQTLGPGPLVPNRSFTFARVDNVPNWHNVTPRLGVAYDLFGTGKTAVKASVGQYLEAPNLGTFARRANPAAGTVTSTTRTWNDANGDFLPQASELGGLQNINFGNTTILTRYSDEVRTNRGFNWETSLSLQHELAPRVSLDAGYYRRAYGNLILTDNQLVARSDYSPYCVTAPLSPNLPNGGGYQVCGLYDIAPALRSATDNVIKFASAFGDMTEIYNGMDVSVNARLPRGITLAGGTSTGRIVNDACFVVDSPQGSYAATNPATVVPGLLNCHVAPPIQTQAKAIMIYPLPWFGIQTSASFQSVPGPMLLANYTATNAEVAPTLGRNLAAGAAGTVVVPLVAPGTMYGDRLNQVDFRTSKIVRFGGSRRFQAFFDLYNALNANPIITYSSSVTITPVWPAPQKILQGRLAKIGFQFDF